MPDLIPLTALGGTAPRSVTHGALTITENPGLALASLALRRGGGEPAPFGLALPGPGHWSQTGGVAAFWTGPGQWMLEAEGRAESDFAAEVAAACHGCSITEQTDAFVAFEIDSATGAAPILALMAKLVNLDTVAFAPGHATRTGFEHMSVFVIRRAERRLALLGMRSAAETLWHALETAAARLIPAA